MNSIKRKTWWLSDPHFYHANVIKYEKRPFKNVHEMNDTIIDNINKKVSPNDTLIITGDFCFGNKKQWRSICSRINCHNLILVQGNHDKNVTKECFVAVVTRMHMQIAGQTVIVSHYPFRWPWWKRLFKKPLRYEERRIHDNGTYFLIHGHVHGNGVVPPHDAGPDERAIHVGVDQWNFEPVSMKTIETLICRRVSKIRDQRAKDKKADEEAVMKALRCLNGGMFM